LADPQLSATAKNIAARLLHHFNCSSGWCAPSYETLARGIGLERRRAMAGVRELEQAGWIIVGRTSHEKAKGARIALPSNNFAFDWCRLQNEASAEDGTNLVHDPALTSAENGTRASAISDTPLVPYSAPPLVPDMAPKHGKIKPGRETGKKSKTRARKSDPEQNPNFIEFLAAFPKRTDARRAAEEYERVLNRQEAAAQEILARAQDYAVARHGQDPQYTKSPFNWLRDKRWRDEPPRFGAFHSKQSGRASGIAGARSLLLPEDFK
jgi:hypothetical protein